MPDVTANARTAAAPARVQTIRPAGKNRTAARVQAATEGGADVLGLFFGMRKMRFVKRHAAVPPI